MAHASSDRISTTQMLVPMAVMGLVMVFFFLFQFSQVMRDRVSLQQVVGNQETSFTEGQKLNAQFGGLVVGTQKLAKEGNATAVDLEKRLKQIGIIQQAVPASMQAPVPAAMESKVPGPVKP